jgi:hypothetical protein
MVVTICRIETMTGHKIVIDSGVLIFIDATDSRQSPIGIRPPESTLNG